VPPPAEESRSDGETATVVMEMMRSLMQTDESWAWSWHCNLAMMAIDAGADRLSANCGAANFMRQAFEIDMTTSHLYRSLITGLEVERDKQSIEARRIDKILSGLTAFDVRRATPIICADRRIDRSKLWLRQASWTADKDSIQLDELKEHEPIKLSDPEPTDWEIWVNPHQQRSCEIQPAHAMIRIDSNLVPSYLEFAMNGWCDRKHLSPAHFAIRRAEWLEDTYSLNGTEWRGFLNGYDSPLLAPDGTDWELWIYDEQVSSQHCLTLAPWDADDTLYLGKYRGYYAHCQIDWAETLINGTVSTLGRNVTTFGAATIDGAKRHFREAVDNYIARCQTKAQAEENLLGVVHD
jgi:hypothetical protein